MSENPTNDILESSSTNKPTRQKFDKETILNALKRDGASIIGEYKTFNRDTYIDFTCKCTNFGKKGLRQIVRTGAFCGNCKPRLEFNRELLDEYISSSDCILIGSYDVLTCDSIINVKCKCGTEHSKTFLSIVYKGGKALCKNCSKANGRVKAKKTMVELFGEEPMKNKELVAKIKATNLEKYGFENPSKNNEVKAKIKETNLVKYGNICSLHGETIAAKVKATMIKRYGVANPNQNKDVRNKTKATCIEKYGVENPLKATQVINKGKRTCLEKYGVEHPLQNKEIMKKVKATIKDKYGVEHLMQSQVIKDRAAKTNIERFGTEFPCQLEEIKEKTKKSNLEKYGKEYPTQTNLVRNKTEETSMLKYGVKCNLMLETNKEKVKNTNLKKYGVECALQSELIKNKSKQTNIEKYGVEYPNQNADIMEKTQKNAKKYKEYTFPSGTVRKVQGYEPFALNELVKIYTEEQIKTERSDVPRIKYEVEGKTKYYFPDIFIPHENKIIEIKSTWTYSSKIDSIKEKAEATREKYIYEIWVYDSKGNKEIY